MANGWNPYAALPGGLRRQLGIAGVAGNGQTQLLEILGGYPEPGAKVEGRLTLNGRPLPLTRTDAGARRDAGIGHIPEDRQAEGLIMDFAAWENTAFGYHDRARYGRGWLMDTAAMRAEALDFVQINYSADEREAERRILPLAAECGMAVIINRPFGGGGLLRRLRDRPLPAWATDIGATSWAQVLLKFVLSHPAVTCAIPGTSRPEHMADNALAGTGVIPDPGFWERHRIDAA